MHRKLRYLLRHNAPRALVATALLTPAAAFAGETPIPRADPAAIAEGRLGPERPLVGPPAPRRTAAKKSAGAGEGREQRKQRKRAESGPFHPVAGAVSYGDAIAAFGNARGRPHEGQDIFAPAGTPVISPSETTVLESGTDGGRGNWAALYDPKRDRTYAYFHLLAPASVAAGEKLKAGEKVGEVGCTGSCSGDHLHFEVRAGQDPYGAAQDPMPLISGWKPHKG